MTAFAMTMTASNAFSMAVMASDAMVGARLRARHDPSDVMVRRSGHEVGDGDLLLLPVDLDEDGALVVGELAQHAVAPARTLLVSDQATLAQVEGASARAARDANDLNHGAPPLDPHLTSGLGQARDGPRL